MQTPKNIIDIKKINLTENQRVKKERKVNLVSGVKTRVKKKSSQQKNHGELNKEVLKINTNIHLWRYL